MKERINEGKEERNFRGLDHPEELMLLKNKFDGTLVHINNEFFAVNDPENNLAFSSPDSSTNSHRSSLDSYSLQTPEQHDPEIANDSLSPVTTNFNNRMMKQNEDNPHNYTDGSLPQDSSSMNASNNGSLCKSKYKYRKHRSCVEDASDEEYDQLREKSTGAIINMEKKDYEKLRPLIPTARLAEIPQNIRVGFVNDHIWKAFHVHVNEMIITKAGRKIFPRIVVEVSGLQPENLYSMCVGFKRLGNTRYKFQSEGWVESGTNEFIPPGNKEFIHPASPMLGEFWMGHHIYFKKIKLTNFAKSEKPEQIQMTSLHKYEPYVKIVAANSLEEQRPENTLIFPIVYSQFMAVTAYQNEQITQLKIMNNPFAKGFRRDKSNSGRKPSSRSSNAGGKNKKLAVNIDIPAYRLMEEMKNQNITGFSESQIFSPYVRSNGLSNQPKIYNEMDYRMAQKAWNGMPGCSEYSIQMSKSVPKQETIPMFSTYSTDIPMMNCSERSIPVNPDCSIDKMMSTISNSHPGSKALINGSNSTELDKLLMSNGLNFVQQPTDVITNSTPHAISQNQIQTPVIQFNHTNVNNNNNTYQYLPSTLSHNGSLIQHGSYTQSLIPGTEKAVFSTNSNVVNSTQIYSNNNNNTVDLQSNYFINGIPKNNQNNMMVSIPSIITSMNCQQNYFNPIYSKRPEETPNLSTSSENSQTLNKTPNNLNSIFSQFGGMIPFNSVPDTTVKNDDNDISKVYNSSIPNYDYLNSASLMDLYNYNNIHKNYSQTEIARQLITGWNVKPTDMNENLFFKNNIGNTTGSPSNAENHDCLILNNGNFVGTSSVIQTESNSQASENSLTKRTQHNTNFSTQNEMNSSELFPNTSDQSCYGDKLEAEGKLKSAFFMPQNNKRED